MNNFWSHYRFSDSILFYGDKAAVMSNFHHVGEFLCSIDWRYQKCREGCATGSKVKNTSQFYKIPEGDTGTSTHKIFKSTDI